MKKSFKKKELNKIAKEIIKKTQKNSSSKKSERATIVALSGDLGSGKTTLTQEISKILGVKENLKSPTFVIMKKYQLGQRNFFHIDAYRLKSSEELLKLGWLEIMNNPNNIIFIEWPEQVRDLIPNDTLWVNLEHLDEETRNIEIML